jgi:Peptidase C13 family
MSFSPGAALRGLVLAAIIASAVALGAPSAQTLDATAVFHAQGELLAGETQALAPARPGVPELYFVGFAGDAEQDVFMKEVETVRRLFDERFGTRDRSLLLVNNRRTLGALPLANSGNLERALGAVAGKMNPEEDVLFLFLTSHGAPNWLAVRFPPLGLQNLSAWHLRRILDNSGIRWRVIVISACYSGSFIDTLKNERTLIVTAAARNRSSFGCSNENDFTYFGDAYFNQALRHGSSFVTAFDEARHIIAARERAEELTPSRPQIYVGAAMRRELARLEQRLDQ